MEKLRWSEGIFAKNFVEIGEDRIKHGNKKKMKKNEQKDAKIKRKNRIGEESKETRIRKIEKDGRGTVIEGV